MANDNVIDELSLQIDANANAALKNLSQMQRQLRNLAKDIGTVVSAGKGLSSLSYSFKTLGNINIGNMSKAISQLQRLSKLEFKPLDSRTIKVDTASIEKQLSGSLNKAAGKKYNIDVASVGKLAESLKIAGDSMAALSATNPRESGLNATVNALKRFSEVDMSGFNTETFTSMVNGIQGISQIGDISSAVNKLVSSLARLANAGENTKLTAEQLPVLSTALKKVVTGLASAGGVPADLNAFVSAIGQLANAGNKTAITAEQLKVLGDALKEFMASMKDAPEINESVLKITESLGRLASSGGKTGTAAKSIGRSLSTMDADSKGAERGIALIDVAMQGLERTFSRAGSIIKSAASKIATSLKNVKNSGNGLSTATANIKNMIGAMVGFRGMVGLVNVTKQVIELGANMTEIDHIVESVFGNMAGYVDKWAKGAIEEFGIAEHSAKQYAGTMSSMFQASGVGYMDAGKMSMDLVGLAGDLSAFYNIDTETAFNKIRSGMAGMVRPLRKQHCAYVQKCA